MWPVFSETERRYVKRWAYGTWGSAQCKFCCGGIACIFGHGSPPLYLCDMRTSAFLGTWYKHGHRWLRALGPEVWRGGTAKHVSFLVTRQLFSHTLTRTHLNTRLFFLVRIMDWLSQLGWSEKGKRGCGVKVRGSKKRVMVLLMSLIKCYSLCNESASFDRPKKQKK